MPGSSRTCSTWETIPGRKSRSVGPSPSDVHASVASPVLGVARSRAGTTPSITVAARAGSRFGGDRHPDSDSARSWPSATATTCRRELRDLDADDLPDGEVTVRVDWSSVNYKDALAVSPKGRVAQISPLVPGVDLAGEVLASDGGDVSAGDERDRPRPRPRRRAPRRLRRGRARARAWVVPLPEGLSAREAMALGTAGFTAALSVVRLEEHGLRAGRRPRARARRDRRRRLDRAWRSSPGAATRSTPPPARPTRPTSCATLGATRGPLARGDLGRVQAADGVPALGRASSTRSAGRRSPTRCARCATAAPSAASGLTGGTDLHTTVFPFILRGVSLLGVDSVEHAGRRAPAQVWRAAGRRPAPARPRGADHARDRARRRRPAARRRARRARRAGGRSCGSGADQPPRTSSRP